ncbi:MAG: type II toxin-antitoxin system HicB family antitoxin [Prevotellaceae bacterium]|jgi:predicted RNase H-like HicB family nuclease|nr:type II toxin-antitoxin system HicB family antitoxin [Prevotellaceae bacterium]
MKKITVEVGKTENNYSAHIIVGDGICVATGKTFNEIKEQMEEALAFHLEGMKEDGDEIPAEFSGKYELVYKFNTESILYYYNGIFTNAALERLTGINQRQLQRYASGKSIPKSTQIKRIEKALHNLGQELISVNLN